MKRLLAALLAICLLTTCAFAEGGEGQPPAPPVETPQPAAAPPTAATTAATPARVSITARSVQSSVFIR